MKKLLLLIFAFSLFSCNNTQNKNNETENNFYTTKIDTTYSSTDRTKIDKIERYIYEQIRESKKYIKTLNLTTELINGNATEFMLIKSTLNRENYDFHGEILMFDNKDDLKLLFHKIDSLEVGMKLKERKHTLHFEINKTKSFIYISKYSSSIDMSSDINFSLKDYEDIKQAFIKFEAE